MDIARNNSMQGLAAISRFVENLAHTNVVVVEAPHRFDLITSFIHSFICVHLIHSGMTLRIWNLSITKEYKVTKFVH